MGHPLTQECIGLMQGIIHWVHRRCPNHVWVMRNERSTTMLAGYFEAEILDLHLQLAATCGAGLDEVRDFTHDGISYYRNC